MKKTIILMVILLCTTMTAFGEEVEVSLPEFDITLNNTKFDNSKEPYPFILYKNVTYLPMTWDISKALGIEGGWSDETGFSVAKSSQATLYHGVNDNQFKEEYKAVVAPFDVRVNGTLVGESAYPVLLYKDITYFPLTYDYITLAFELDYKWSDKNGLSLGANEEIIVIEPVIRETFKFTRQTYIDMDTSENGFFTSQCYDDNPIAYNFGINYNVDGDYVGKYYDVSLEAFDDNDQVVVHTYLKFGNRYYGHEFGNGRFTHVYDYADKGAVYYKLYLDFYEANDYEYMLNRFTKNITIEYFDNESISLDMIKTEESNYMSRMYQPEMQISGMSSQALIRQVVNELRIRGSYNEYNDKIYESGFSYVRYPLDDESLIDEIKASEYGFDFMVTYQNGYKTNWPSYDSDVIILYNNEHVPYKALINNRIKSKSIYAED